MGKKKRNRREVKIESPVDLEKLRNTFTPCPNCKARIEAAAAELEQVRPVLHELVEFAIEGLNGDCGCPLLAPDDGPCIICQAQALL